MNDKFRITHPRSGFSLLIPDVVAKALQKFHGEGDIMFAFVSAKKIDGDKVDMIFDVGLRPFDRDLPQAQMSREAEYWRASWTNKALPVTALPLCGPTPVVYSDPAARRITVTVTTSNMRGPITRYRAGSVKPAPVVAAPAPAPVRCYGVIVQMGAQIGSRAFAVPEAEAVALALTLTERGYAVKGDDE